MSKHTPGPWRVTGPNVRAGHALLAIVCDHWADEKTPEPEKEANARLIAAAPDLLDALKEITLEHGMTEKARAAIAKATGENK